MNKTKRQTSDKVIEKKIDNQPSEIGDEEVPETPIDNENLE